MGRKSVTGSGNGQDPLWKSPTREEEEGSRANLQSTMAPGVKRVARWGKGDNKKFNQLVLDKKINWGWNDTAYLRKIQDKYWPGRSTPTFRNNWKAATSEFRSAELLKGKRAELNNQGKPLLYAQFSIISVNPNASILLVFF